ncbi:DUF6973 domain-containing protein [Paenibacillus koleovorans]|uniref:DUF6973 domain-containing protein n=1 Tax=Paenibacillus koleovorans TaxID=121608 RepID=UPI000FD82031|nr:hypothetical protein [Paenibacillus koleovorans]
MKKRKLIASMALTGMLFGLTCTTIFAADSAQSSSVVSSSTQGGQYPVYSTQVYLQLVKEVEQGLITTDEQGWARLAELNKMPFRHAYWNCLMTRDIGHDQAKLVADIHEEYNPCRAVANEMDLHNNQQSRYAYTFLPSGSNTSDSALDTVIKGKVNTGALLHIVNEQLVWTNV